MSERTGVVEERVDGCQMGNLWRNGHVGEVGLHGRRVGRGASDGWGGGHYITYVCLSMYNEFYFNNKVQMHSLVFESC